MTEKQYDYVVIDTDQYSGNFERELVAWITGFYDSRGSDYAELRTPEQIASMDWTNDFITPYLESWGEQYPEWGVIVQSGPNGDTTAVKIVFEGRVSLEQREALEEQTKLFPEIMSRLLQSYQTEESIPEITSIEWWRVTETKEVSRIA